MLEFPRATPLDLSSRSKQDFPALPTQLWADKFYLNYEQGSLGALSSYSLTLLTRSLSQLTESIISPSLQEI